MIHTSNDARYLRRAGILLTLWLIARLLMCLGSVWNKRFPLVRSPSLMASTMLLISKARASANSEALIPLGAWEVIAGVDAVENENPGISGLFLFRLIPLSFSAFLPVEDAILVSEPACKLPSLLVRNSMRDTGQPGRICACTGVLAYELGFPALFSWNSLLIYHLVHLPFIA